MDLTLAPKLLAAALVGASVAALPRSAAPAGEVTLKFEWIATGKSKTVEAVYLRAMTGQRAEVRQGGRSVEATPTLAPDGSVSVRLKVIDTTKPGIESLDTTVRTASGETVTVMGTTRKAGKEARESLLFLTAGPVDR